MMKTEKASDFVHRIASGAVEPEERAELTFDEVAESRQYPLLVEMKNRGARQGGTVLVVFHGALSKKKRGYPYFEGAFAKAMCSRHAVTLISICDPTLARESTLTSSWFQGAADLPLPQMIGLFLASLRSGLAPERLILFGSSMGGHAALLHGLALPGCVVVAKNPIASIQAYRFRHVPRYLKSCWPGATSLKDIADRVTLDVGKLYANGHDHTVIYLQNPTDHHFRPQAVRFLKQVKNAQSMLFVTEPHEGYQGHTLPVRYVATWLEAAVIAATTGRQAIADAYVSLAGPAAAPSGAERPIPLADIRIAARLAAQARTEQVLSR